MQIGIDSFVETSLEPKNGAPDQAQRVSDLLEEIELADQVGLDVFGIGEHHRREFVASAPAVILAAAAARTKQNPVNQRRYCPQLRGSGAGLSTVCHPSFYLPGTSRDYCGARLFH